MIYEKDTYGKSDDNNNDDNQMKIRKRSICKECTTTRTPINQYIIMAMTSIPIS